MQIVDDYILLWHGCRASSFVYSLSTWLYYWEILLGRDCTVTLYTQTVFGGYWIWKLLFMADSSWKGIPSLLRCLFWGRPLEKKLLEYIEYALDKQIGWGCRIHRLPLCKGVRPPTNECPDMTLNNLMVTLQWFWSFGECGVPLHCHWSQVHFSPEC